MTTFDSTKTSLSKLLDEAVSGELQLPDFQRGWVWDDEHIRSLLVSVGRSFPIGAVMLLETGGETRFQLRPIEGITLPEGTTAERLILDGQQRLTSLTQVLKLIKPVETRDDKKRELKRYYYFDIQQALLDTVNLEDALVGLGDDRMLRTNFGRDVVLDLTTPAKEYASFHFPCNQILNSDEWEEGLNARHPDRFGDYMRFRTQVLNAFRNYMVPVIELKKETTKEAVCLVFEKVNTGGVPLSVFELVTATYAADGFNLRQDWFGDKAVTGRREVLRKHSLLKGLEATDFLQAVSLLHSYERQRTDLSEGKTGKEVTAVSAKREHVLSIPLSVYRKWADKLVDGFLEAEQFLRHIGFHDLKFLPYRAQLVPLAAVLTHIGERWLEPRIQDLLARWYWCGVFGELYGSATETRIALDLVNLMRCIEEPDAPVPVTIVAAGFQASRLDTMRTRTSAAYRGLYVLLQHRGAMDFFWKTRITDLDRSQKGVDIHHIFPRKWCGENGVLRKVADSIVNKTPISLRANRKIGGKAPSEYLAQLQQDKSVQLQNAAMDDILRSHSIEPNHLRADHFDRFYAARRAALLALIEEAMGKRAVGVEDLPDEDVDENDEDEEDDVAEIDVDHEE